MAGGMKYSDIIGSLLSPSLPDSRDLKDKLHAAVDYTVDDNLAGACMGAGGTDKTCNTTTSINKGYAKSKAVPGSCSSVPNNVASSAAPYSVNLNEYIKKDSIPCYGCNLP